MPSGAKKRKAAKKKKVNNTPTNSNQGENDSGELSSPVSQENNHTLDPLIENEGVEVEKEVEKREGGSCESKTDDANIEIEIGSKSKSSTGSSSSSSDSSDDESQVVEKKEVILVSAPVESVQEIEAPIVEPVKPVDYSLLESVTKVYDETKSEVKKELVVEDAPVIVEKETVHVSEPVHVSELEPVQISEIDSKDEIPASSVVVESVLKENGVVELPVVEEKVSSVLKDCVETSMPKKDLISEDNGVDCVNEVDTVEHSDRQPHAAASVPLAVHKTTSWKGCCGLFELFSGSERN